MTWLALPQFGLSTVFVVAFVSATLLPLGSEPAVFGLVKLNPDLFWAAVLVATAGNTLGGAFTWWNGLLAERAYERVKHSKPPNARALRWLQQFGAKACLLSFLPVVGDPGHRGGEQPVRQRDVADEHEEAPGRVLKKEAEV